MKKIELWVKGFFGFSRAETNAFLVLIPLMVLLIFSEPAYQYWFVRQPRDYSNERHRLDSLIAMMSFPHDSVMHEVEIKPNELFQFNPNLCTLDEMMRLGFNKPLANRIVNFRSKGGKFFKKKDLMKIYGMDSTFYQRISEYIVLPENFIVERPILKSAPKEKLVVVKFDLNTADTSQLKKIYGIGPKLALRIIAYRTKLGGFISDQQIKEVYGLDSSVVRNLMVRSFVSESFLPQQFNVNTADEAALSAHPYIKYKFAKAIIAYRKQHGLFASVDELKKITIIRELELQRMKPYLIVQ